MVRAQEKRRTLCERDLQGKAFVRAIVIWLGKSGSYLTRAMKAEDQDRKMETLSVWLCDVAQETSRF